MYGDEKIRVEIYCDKLKAKICQFDILSFHLLTQNEAMMSAHEGVPRKVHVEDKDVWNMSIFNCNKKIFVARQK